MLYDVARPPPRSVEVQTPGHPRQGRRPGRSATPQGNPPPGLRATGPTHGGRSKNQSPVRDWGGSVLCHPTLWAPRTAIVSPTSRAAVRPGPVGHPSGAPSAGAPCGGAPGRRDLKIQSQAGGGTSPVETSPTVCSQGTTGESSLQSNPGQAHSLEHGRLNDGAWNNGITPARPPPESAARCRGET